MHFPRNAELAGEFIYRVTPVFMNDDDELSYGEPQDAAIELRRETYPGKLNVTFTRGFVSSQAFVDRFEQDGRDLDAAARRTPTTGSTFEPTHPKADGGAARGWASRRATPILEVLDQAIADGRRRCASSPTTSTSREVVTRLERLGSRLQVIIDDSDEHGEAGSRPRRRPSERLALGAGATTSSASTWATCSTTRRSSSTARRCRRCVCGSTNFTWRGFYVQSNNAVILRGADRGRGRSARRSRTTGSTTRSPGFGAHARATLARTSGSTGIDARVAFSPHVADNALLAKIADDIANGTTSSLLYSLAFLARRRGADPRGDRRRSPRTSGIFVYGISDHKVGGIDLQTPDGNVLAGAPGGARRQERPRAVQVRAVGRLRRQRMHHKFVVIDFDKPTARVYMGSYNFSPPADVKNGENLLLVRDRRVAVAYAVEALRIFDHYHFRVVQKEAGGSREPLVLAGPPRASGDTPWWDRYYTDPQRVRDRELFA